MLERLRIANFQRHRRLEVKFDPLVTTIVGPSDSGKSAIIRALRWVAFNRPRGEAFIREGSHVAVARLLVDGFEIERKRGPGLNLYRLGGDAFEAFGAEVPEPIAKHLNLAPENFGLQHDAPFWFSLSAPEVSRRLNHIVNLSSIDSTMKILGSERRRAEAEYAIAAERFHEAETRREKLDPVLAAEEDLAEVENAFQAKEAVATDLASLGLLLSKAERVEALRKRLRVAKTNGFAAKSAGVRVRKLRKRTETLRKLLREARKASKILGVRLPAFGPVRKAKDRLEAAERLRDLLAELLSKINGADRSRNRHRHRLIKLKAKLAKVEKCPLCRSPIR